MTFDNSILAGLTLVRDAIRSENYVASSEGWSIERNGDAEFNDVTVRGELIVGAEPEMAVAVRNPIHIGSNSAGVYWDGQDVDLDADNPGGITQLHGSGATFGGIAQLWLFPQLNEMSSGFPADAPFIIIENNGKGNASVFISQVNSEDFTYQNEAVIARFTEQLRVGNTNGGHDRLVTREVGASNNEANSGTFTSTETMTDTVTASQLVTGRVYEIEWTGRYTNSASGVNTVWQIREDSLTGTIRDQDIHHNPNTSGQKVQLRARFTATSTAAKTFVVTGRGSTGTGTVQRLGAVSSPSVLTVKEVAQ